MWGGSRIVRGVVGGVSVLSRGCSRQARGVGGSGGGCPICFGGIPLIARGVPLFGWGRRGVGWGYTPALVGSVACWRYAQGTMRVTVTIDLEIADGKRPGTRYGRADRIARAVGAFADRLRAVSSVRSVEVRHPADGDQPGAVLMSFDGSEVWPMGLPLRTER